MLSTNEGSRVGEAEVSSQPATPHFQDSAEGFVTSQSFRNKLPLELLPESVFCFRTANSLVIKAKVVDHAGEQLPVAIKVTNPEKYENNAGLGTLDQRHAKQLAVAKMLLDHGLPIAKIHAAGSEIIGGHDCRWTVEQWLPGESVEEGRLSPEKAEEAWKVIGGLYKRINGIKTSGWGQTFDPKLQAFTQTWQEHIDAKLDGCKLEFLVDRGVLKEGAPDMLRARFERLKTLDQRYNPCLNHLDLHLEYNFLVNPGFLQGTEKLRTAGIIDFDTATSSPGSVYELAGVRSYHVVSGKDSTLIMRAVLVGMGIEPTNFYQTELGKDVHAAAMLTGTRELRHILYKLDCNDDVEFASRRMNRILSALEEDGIPV